MNIDSAALMIFYNIYEFMSAVMEQIVMEVVLRKVKIFL